MSNFSTTHTRVGWIAVVTGIPLTHGKWARANMLHFKQNKHTATTNTHKQKIKPRYGIADRHQTAEATHTYNIRDTYTYFSNTEIHSHAHKLTCIHTAISHTDIHSHTFTHNPTDVVHTLTNTHWHTHPAAHCTVLHMPVSWWEWNGLTPCFMCWTSAHEFTLIWPGSWNILRIYSYTFRKLIWRLYSSEGRLRFCLINAMLACVSQLVKINVEYFIV